MQKNTYTFYQYVHCPFCVRVRMTLAFFKQDYKSIVVDYDDEQTPLDLCQKKMLPILKVNDEKPINESLDILRVLGMAHDPANEFLFQTITQDPRFLPLDHLLSRLGSNIHSLAMPFFIYLPEFNQRSREYFQKKKEEKRGPFTALLSQQKNYIKQLQLDLNDLKEHISMFYLSDHFSALDILLASHLYAMYLVPEFQYDSEIHHYLQRVKEKTNFIYLKDLFKSPYY